MWKPRVCVTPDKCDRMPGVRARIVGYMCDCVCVSVHVSVWMDVSVRPLKPNDRSMTNNSNSFAGSRPHPLARRKCPVMTLNDLQQGHPLPVQLPCLYHKLQLYVEHGVASAFAAQPVTLPCTGCACGES